MTKSFIVLALFLTISLHAADIPFMKGSTLYISNGLRENNFYKVSDNVKEFKSDGKLTAFIKGGDLYMVINEESNYVSGGVKDFKILDGVLSYVRDDQIFVVGGVNPIKNYFITNDITKF
jgi:hypothetical protein